MPGRKAPEAARREQILDAAYRVAVKRRLAGLTIREVAREAHLSTGLVLFHFKTREALVNALLEWLLRSAVLQPPTHGPSEGPDAASLCALVSAEASRLSSDRLRTELFFDFWVAGTRTARLRTQMRRALTEYRREFRARAAVLLQHVPCSTATPDGLAAAAVSFIHGCAIQAVIDPDAFDLRATLSVLDMLAQRLQEGPPALSSGPHPAASTARRTASRRAGRHTASKAGAR